MEDSVKMKREIIKIEGDRNLYSYTFEVDEKEQTNSPREESDSE